jgi:uncharacterized membrane protein
MNYFAFILMSIATYLTRASGFVVMGLSNRNERLEKGLSYIPGSVFIAMIAPHALNHGHEELIGFIVTAIVQYMRKNVLLSLFFGLATVIALRLIFHTVR